MGDEKETWKVKTLDEILLEKKRRRELEERTDNKCKKKVMYLELTIHLCCWSFGVCSEAFPVTHEQ